MLDAPCATNLEYNQLIQDRKILDRNNKHLTSIWIILKYKACEVIYMQLKLSYLG